MSFKCRFCKNDLGNHFLDLGHQPPSNAYLTSAQLEENEKTYPLKLYVCNSCWLVQIPEYLTSEELFTKDYAYLSSTSLSWCKHAEKFAEKSIKKLALDKNKLVIEIASNDGYLLQYFKKSNIPSFGIEPTELAANEAEKKGIKTLREFFCFKLAEEITKSEEIANGGADLVVANNVLAHVPNINDFMAGIAKLLKYEGFASFEFPHLLNTIKYNQFDTIYHEHYSYLSLKFLKRLCISNNLFITDVEKLNTHGGSLRVWITPNKKSIINDSVYQILDEERNYDLEDINTYNQFESNARKIKYDLLSFLIKNKQNEKLIIGYGAAAKGNTLLNYCGIKSDLLPFVLDKAKSKQKKFLPGSHIPIIDPIALKELKVDKILLLPWNLIDEISPYLSGLEIVTAIPSLKIRKA